MVRGDEHDDDRPVTVVTACVALLALSACYAPYVASNVACEPERPACPYDQACVERGGRFVCSSEPGDEVDAPTDDSATDGDADGILDLADNCPTTANPAQANYDGDRYGDACDPCPPFASNAPIDSDVDGVSDDCDPDPMRAGDVIERFDTFRDGLSGWTAEGTWSVVADGVSVDLAAGARGVLVLPMPAAARTSVSAAFTPSELRTFGTYAGMGVIAQAEVACQLVLTSIGQRRLALIKTVVEDTLTSRDLAFVTGGASMMTLTTAGAVHRCRSGMTEITATTNVTTAAPMIGLRARGVRGTFHWALVLSSAAP